MAHETAMMVISALAGFAFSRREYTIAMALGIFVALKVFYLEG